MESKNKFENLKRRKQRFETHQRSEEILHELGGLNSPQAKQKLWEEYRKLQSKMDRDRIKEEFQAF